VAMGIKTLEKRGITVAEAVKSALGEIKLSAEQTFIKIIQEDYRGLFIKKDAVIAVVYEEEESRQAFIKEALNIEKRYEKGQLLVKVPPQFHDTAYMKDEKERFDNLLKYLQQEGFRTPDEETLKQISADSQSVNSFICVQKFEAIELNDEGGAIYLEYSPDMLLCRGLIFFHGPITKGMILKALSSFGCCWGILNQTLDYVLEYHIDGFFTLAQGKAPIPPIPGEIEFFFEADENKLFEQMTQLSKSDTRTVKKINVADRNQMLLRIGKHTPGVNGFQVDGKVLLAPEYDPESSAIKTGENVYFSDDGREIYAKQSGHIRWKKSERFLDIEAIYTVEGNVDFNEGNIIGFVGKVLVMGDVRPKFSVIAEGDVEIRGSVEDAIIESLQGSVFVGGAIVHTGEGYIQAKETVHGMLAINANIRAKKIMIEKEAKNSTLNAEEEVIATGNPGVIMGGVTSARLLIEANMVGSESWVDTKLYVGDVREMKKRLNNMRQKCYENKETLQNNVGVIKLLQKRQEKSPLSEPQQMQLNFLLEKNQELEQDIEYYTKEQEKITVDIEKRKDAKLKIVKKIFPKVDIYLYDTYCQTEQEENALLYAAREGLITRLPL
jgi:uncharacterized protein (DUF342 family)